MNQKCRSLIASAIGEKTAKAFLLLSTVGWIAAFWQPNIYLRNLGF
jgi:hypothetical protein